MKSQQMPGRPLSFRGMSGGVSAAVRLLRAAFRLMAADRVETLVRSTSWLRSIMPSYCRRVLIAIAETPPIADRDCCCIRRLSASSAEPPSSLAHARFAVKHPRWERSALTK